MVDQVVVGAAIGALATTIGGAWRDRAGARRNAALLDADAAARWRVAVRLIELELFAAEMAIRRAVASGTLRTRLSGSDWSLYRGEIGVKVGVADWHCITAAYDAIWDLNELIDCGRADEAVAEGEALSARWHTIRTAAWILRSYVGDAEDVVRAIETDSKLAARLWPKPSGGADECRRRPSHS